MSSADGNLSNPPVAETTGRTTGKRITRLGRVLRAVLPLAIPLMVAGAIIAAYQARIGSLTKAASEWGHELELRADPIKVKGEQPITGKISRAVLRELVVRVQREEVLKDYKIHAALHGLRLNSNYERTANLKPLGSRELLGAVLDDRQYLRLWPGAGPLLISSDFGVTTWISNEPAAAPHTDKVISTLAEIGIAPNHAVVLRSGTATVADLIRDSVARFDLMQNEIEWSTIAFASYMPPVRSWKNRFGREYCFDDLVGALLAKPNGQGPCYGTHTLYSLAYLLNVDHSVPILSPNHRDAAVERLRQTSALLEAGQYRSGHWGDRWHLPAPHDRRRQFPPGIALKNLLRITGHHLEWIAIAPPVARPPEASIIQACNAIADDMIRLPESEIGDNYTVLTHALRAICLLYGIGIEELLSHNQKP